MTDSGDELFTRRMIQTVLTVAGLAGLIAIAWIARRALILIYISGLIATGLSPVIRRIERHHLTRKRNRLPRGLAILVVYAVFVLGVMALAAAMLPPLIEQATALWSRAPTLFVDAQDSLVKWGLLPRHFTLQEAVQQSQETPGSDAAKAMGTVNAVISAGSAVIGGAVGVVTVAILTFYLLVEAGAMFDFLLRFVPLGRRPRLQHAAQEAVVKVSAWMQANIMLGGLMGLVSGSVLALLGEPFFYVVAVVAALGEGIPMVGPIIAGTLAVTIALTKSMRLAIVVGIFFVALHEIEANILVPKIMEKRVGVNAVSVMIALLIGFEVAGLVGAVLAIPTAAIVSVIVNELPHEGIHELH